MDNSWWDDFSNNLATDLAPLVALFGESVTKQYLSECLTVEDVVIFAVAPLGVITAVVSAIRVCGTPSLRAFVGRAQEGAGTAEAELCSSTSRDVCELYSNGGIARVFGRPKLLEIVHDTQAGRDEFYPPDGSEARAGIYSFPEYIKTKRGKKEWPLEQKSTSIRKSVDQTENGQIQPTKAVFAPNPNLSLNVGIRPHNRLWFLAAATLGVVLQLFILVWAALTRYYFHWLRNDRGDQYSFPLTFIGTVSLCFGMAACAHLIESKTKEQTHNRAAPAVGDTPSNMYWVQPGNQSIGDQIFDSFAYSDSKKLLKRYITSWKDTTNRSSPMVSIWTAVITTSTGFILQFLGLRASHSSVAIMQLGGTILMSAIRAGLRTQRLRNENNFMADAPDFYEGHELDCLALKLGRQRSTDAYPSSTEAQPRYLWKVFNSISRSPISQTIHRIRVSSSPFLSATERLSVKAGPSAVLTGFRTQSGHYHKHIAIREISETMSAEYCSECKDQGVCWRNTCNGDPNEAAKAFFYRAQLSRMTGIERSKSTLSSDWGEELVKVRSVSLALSRAIEETMHILFSPGGRSPVVLHEEWEDALSIFWAVQCSLVDPLVNKHEESIIHMSLKRPFNEDGIPEGPWGASRSEIEAVLGLWLWSLKEKETRERDEVVGDVLEDVDEKEALQLISRILSIQKNPDNKSNEIADLKIWRRSGDVIIESAQLKVQDPDSVFQSGNAQNSVWWEKERGEVFVTNAEKPPPNYTRYGYRFFGWRGMEQHQSYNNLSIIHMESPNSLLGNCALELYSSFLSAIMHAVKDIGGETHFEDYEDNFTVHNQTIQSIQDCLIQNSLCNAGDAFACTIPILKCQDKLPAPDIIMSKAVKMADKYLQQGNWSHFRRHSAWVLHLRSASLVSAHNQQDPTKIDNATNDLRLSFIESCENYRQTLLRDNEEAITESSLGIVKILKIYSKDETIQNIPLIWHDIGNVPYTQAQSGQPLSLADTLICYSQAALYHMNDKQLRSYVVRDILKMSETHTGSKKVTSGPAQGLERSDLSSLLYFLEAPSLREPIQLTKAMIAASQKGWIMVIKSLVVQGASVDQEDENERTALSYAAELGDINTASTLMDMGASLRNRGVNDDEHRKLAIHFAAKQGHATIIRSMIEKFSGSPVLDDEDEEGMTPLSWAITSGNAATVCELTRKGVSISPNSYDTKKPALHLAIQQDKEDIVDVLLKCEEVDSNHNRGSTVNSPPLIHALRLRKEAIFDKLLDFAETDADCPDTSGRTALWWAAALGLDTYVQKLLDSGKVKDPYKVDKSGHTALSIAAEGGHVAIVRKLRNIEGADFAIKPIIIAAKNGHIAVVEELLASKFNHEDSKSLLESNKLGGIWVQIQQSGLWESEHGQRLGIPPGFELNGVEDSELRFAEDLCNQPYEELV